MTYHFQASGVAGSLTDIPPPYRPLERLDQNAIIKPSQSLRIPTRGCILLEPTLETLRSAGGLDPEGGTDIDTVSAAFSLGAIAFSLSLSTRTIEGLICSPASEMFLEIERPPDPGPGRMSLGDFFNGPSAIDSDPSGL